MREKLLEILLGVMRFSNWVLNQVFNDLTSCIRFRLEGAIPWSGDQKAKLYYYQGHHLPKKNPCAKILLCFFM